MATGKVTIRSVDALVAIKGDAFLWDDEIRGFGVKATKAGKKNFVYQYRMGGRGSKTQRWTIGAYGQWTPDDARKEAKRLGKLVDVGVNPIEDKRQRDRAAVTLAFSAYVKTFTKGYLETEWGTSWEQAKRQLEMHVTPHLKEKPLPDITAADCNAVLDHLIGRPALRRNVWAVMSKLFSWAEDREDIDRAPKMTTPPTVKRRKRILSPHELIACWRASYELEAPRGALVRLLMITLQRRSEVAAVPWAELKHNEGVWHMPGERTKNNEDHLVPLSELARAELDAIGWKRRGLALPCSTGKTPVSNFSDMKLALDKAMLPILQELADKQADAAGEDRHEVELEPWRLHDLRRTGTTNLQALGFPIEVGERVINHHQGGEASGIRAVYNLYEYLPEKTKALEAWSAHLKALVDGQVLDTNVVSLASARA